MTVQPGGSYSPLHSYITVQQGVDKELAKILKDAADEAERMIFRLGEQAGLGASVRRAQVQSMLKSLRQAQADAYGSMTKTLEAGLGRAASAAAEADKTFDSPLFRALGFRLPEYEASRLTQAIDNVSTVKARAFNNIPLSSQVYKTKALSDGLVDRAVNRGILLGSSAKDIAKSVSGLIRPDVPGGVSYAAMRLGRTELNNAFHQTQIAMRADNPWTTGMKWNLSGSHPKHDACNDYADKSHFKDGPAGVFKPDEVPDKPHPNCLCYMTTEVVDEDEFVAALVNGDYTGYLEGTTYTHGSGLVC